MKKCTLLIFSAWFFTLNSLAQTVTLAFTGRDAANNHVETEFILVTNHTKNWQEFLFWPDTVLTIQNATGVHDGGWGNAHSLQLSPNSPNPFNGTTDVNLILAEAGSVTLEIADVGGHLVCKKEHSLNPGLHQFRVSLARAGTYVMSARQEGKVSSIKMVCNHSGSASSIEYSGADEVASGEMPSTKSFTRGVVARPYEIGDQMELSAAAIINGVEVESQHLNVALVDSQTYVLQFFSLQLHTPTVITASVTDITGNSAVCGGVVTNAGSDSVTARGVCIGLTPSPTIAGRHTVDGQGVGTFSTQVTGLSPNLTYYVRAYAVSSVGIAYGDDQSFVIPVNPNGDARSCLDAPVLVDVDGNVYNTVQIGEHCWMRENLRTTRYADGTSIPQGETYSLTTAFWYYPMNEPGNKSNYGLLYNWAAVMHGAPGSDANPSGVQGVCPDGWHLPSDAEWTQLHGFVNAQASNVCSGIDGQIGKSLAATVGWDDSGFSDSCVVGNTQYASNNATGFGALPAGFYSFASLLSGESEYGGLGYVTFFWTSTDTYSPYGYYDIFYWGLHTNYALMIHNSFYDNYGEALSVRCVKN